MRALKYLGALLLFLPALASAQSEELPGPGSELIVPVARTPDEAEADEAQEAQQEALGVGAEETNSQLAGGVELQAMRSAGGTSAQAPLSIVELARALKNDPDLIYEHVRDTIETYPIWGLQKGGLGALIDGVGTAWDQADLMVQLLRASSITAKYVQGTVDLTPAQITKFYGIPTTNACAVRDYFANGFIPVSVTTSAGVDNCNGTLIKINISHVWVQADIGGTNYVFDPAHKPHTVKLGINLNSATGYDQSKFLNGENGLPGAFTGSTRNSNYVQNINRDSIRSSLTSYSTALINYIRSNVPAADLDDIIGGKLINPTFGGPNLRQTQLRDDGVSYQASAQPAVDDVPDNRTVELAISLQGVITRLRSDEIYGKRLTITFHPGTQPDTYKSDIYLDGEFVTTDGSSGADNNSELSVGFTITHKAYPLANRSNSFPQKIRVGPNFIYVISNGWGPTSRGLVEKFHRELVEAKSAPGADDSSETVLGSSLAVLSANWLAKADMVTYIGDRIAGANTLVHHRVGIAGYNGSPYVDLPGNRNSIWQQDGNADKGLAAFQSSAMHLSILESNAVQETAGVSAVSSAKLIDIMASDPTPANRIIYSATSANYSSQVQPNLIGCPSFSFGTNDRIIIPKSCVLNENSWSGYGYFKFTLNNGVAGVASIISGGLHGGDSSVTLLPIAFNLQASINFEDSDYKSRRFTDDVYTDPIDVFRGNFLYGHEDINLGVGNLPYALKFQSLYNSGARQMDGPLGKGWTHNLAITAKAGGDGFQGLGEDSPIDAATTIAEILVSLDLLSDSAKPLDKMVIATLAQRWFGDQLLDNTVAVTQGQSAELFVKLPDGSYNASQGSSAKLVRNGDGTFTYSTADKTLLNFDASGNIANWVYSNGARVNFTYDVPGGKLISVVNSLGRSLTLDYTGSRLSSVSDGSRSVTYGYTGDNLTSFTNAELKTTTFQYDLPGRMIKSFLPQNPSNPAVTNVYDSLGRVQTQTSATQTGPTGKKWNYYFAGSRSEEVAPDNAREIHYFDAAGRILAKIDNLLVGDPVTNGRKIVNTLDGQERVIETIYPEGNKLHLTYDDASCASADKRCTHNIKERRLIAKTGGACGSGTPCDPIVTSFTYESGFNKVLTATDGKLKVTDFAYDPATGNLTSVTLPAATSGGARPQTSFTYQTFAGAGGLPSFTLPTSVTRKIDASTTTVVTTAYNAANFYVPQTSIVDPTGLNLVTTVTYDATGNLTNVDGPRTDVTDVTQYGYDNERRFNQVTDAASKVTRLFYDADGNLQRTARQAPGGQWQALCKEYSFSGKVRQTRGPALVTDDQTCPGTTTDIAISDYDYDDQDRLLRVTERQPAGQGGNRVTETSYFPDDQVRQVKRAVGSGVAQDYATYTYTASGLPSTLKDAKGQLTTYTYDGHDRLQTLRYPKRTGIDAPTGLGTSAPCNILSYAAGDDCEVYDYDANGNLVSKRTRAGQTIAYAYDDLNRVKQKSRPDAANNVAYQYDLLGRVTLVYQDSSAVQRHPIAFTYDKAGRVTHLVEDGWTSDYDYDEAGNRKLFRYPYQGSLGSPTNDGFYVTYDYDLLNRMTKVRERGAASGIGVLASYSYDELSRPMAVVLGNGTSRSITYKPDSSVSTLALDLDSTGTANDNLYTLTYNQIPQINLVQTTKPNFEWTGYSDIDRAYQANGLNQYSQSGSATFSYDGNGNLGSSLSPEANWGFVYSAENELITASRSGVSLAYRYDGLGRLDRRQLNSNAASNYRYDGQAMIAEHADGASPQSKRYVHGKGMDEPLVQYARQDDGSYVRTWFAADFKGSIVATTYDAGTTLAVYSYGDFGEPNTSSGPAFRYTGQWFDPDSMLYYYKARWYSPNLGRFLSADPIGTADDINLYTYVRNDPLNLWDPSGTSSYGYGDIVVTGNRYAWDNSLFECNSSFESCGAGAQDGVLFQVAQPYWGTAFGNNATVGTANRFNPFGRINSGKVGNFDTALEDIDSIASANNLPELGSVMVNFFSTSVMTQFIIPTHLGDGWWVSKSYWTGDTTISNSGLGFRYNAETGKVNIDIPGGFKLPTGGVLGQNETVHYRN